MILKHITGDHWVIVNYLSGNAENISTRKYLHTDFSKMSYELYPPNNHSSDISA